MPTTRKQKKARKSREAEMLSDIENLDIMLGGDHFNRNERSESLNSNQARRPGSFLVMNLKMRMKIGRLTLEMTNLVQMPN